MHKMASEDTKDGRMFRKTETKIEKRLRERITQKDEKGENRKVALYVGKHVYT